MKRILPFLLVLAVAIEIYPIISPTVAHGASFSCTIQGFDTGHTTSSGAIPLIVTYNPAGDPTLVGSVGSASMERTTGDNPNQEKLLLSQSDWKANVGKPVTVVYPIGQVTCANSGSTVVPAYTDTTSNGTGGTNGGGGGGTGTGGNGGGTSSSYWPDCVPTRDADLAQWVTQYQPFMVGKKYTVPVSYCVNPDKASFINAGIQVPDANGVSTEPNYGTSDHPCDGDPAVKCNITFIVPAGFKNYPATSTLRINLLGSTGTLASTSVNVAWGADGCNAITDTNEQNKCKDAGVCYKSSDPTKCMAQLGCQRQQSRGYVFISTFNNSCVTLPEFIQTLVYYVLTFASIVAGIMLLRGGFGILVSRGTPASVADARSMLTNAIVGLVLVAIAFVIIQFLNGAFQSIDPSINLLGPFSGGL